MENYETQKKYTLEQGHNNRFLGEAAEHRILSELLLRHINAAPMLVDDGVDVVLENGKKIQIKSSHSEFSSSRGYRYPVYLFSLRGKKYVNSKNITLRPKFNQSKIDFLILWCVDHNWFYIIPSSEVNQTMINIPINPEKISKYQQYLNAWDSLME